MKTAAEPAVSMPPPAVVVNPTHVCANCGAPMRGPYCYACGQAEKGMIRQLASVLADALDTIFNIDARVFRSLLPLYLRPGFLTLEYFAGRRVRYVTPFRLFFFLCLVAFFAIQLALNVGYSDFQWKLDGSNDDIASAPTIADVRTRTAQALAGIDTAKNVAEVPPAAIAALAQAAAEIQKKSDGRIAYLEAREASRAKGETLPPDPFGTSGEFMFNGMPWDPTTHPIKLGWLPDFANAKLNDMARRAKENVSAAKRNPRHLVEGVFARLPWTLGLLMPVFAVLLKIVYIFRRRLYMEHLMVALHSHAFAFMSLLLLALINLLHSWTSGVAGFGLLLDVLRAAVWIWLPVYLFLMQKRVYRQGWIMTFVKFGAVGLCYSVIVSFGLVGALLASLAFE